MSHREHTKLGPRDDGSSSYEHGFEDGKAARATPSERERRFVERMKQLGQAMPPNAVSMEIQRALARYDEEKNHGK